MADATAALKAYYAARAGEFERVYAKPERQADLRRLERVLPEIFAGRRVLEVACGTGYWTAFLAREARAIVAVDATPETLAVARGKPWPPGRVDFRLADAYALPDELGLFDAAFAGFWWSHVPVRSRARFLGALDRRLAAGATVVLIDNRFVAGNSGAIDHRDGDGNTYQRRWLEDGSEHLVLKNFPSEAELRSDVGAFGRDMQFTALEYFWLFRYEKGAAA